MLYHEKIKHKSFLVKSNWNYLKTLNDNILNSSNGTPKPGYTDSIWFGDNYLLIRLESINEGNFELLTSTIQRLDKNWEITKVIGESFLKIYL